MKKTLLIAFILFQIKTYAQDMIYFTDGTKIPGKISEINTDSVKFKNLANPTGPFYSRGVASVQLAFNAAGDYLVFGQGKAVADNEKADFINPPAKTRPFGVVVDLKGNLSTLTMTDENETEIMGIDSGKKNVKLSKSNIAFIISKNGSHQLLTSMAQALPYLVADKPKINALLATGAANQAAAAAVTPAPVEPPKALAHTEGEYIAPDMALFGAKAIEKTREFTSYLQSISAVKTDRDAAAKSITLATNLFLNQGVTSRVEVSNVKTPVKKKYLIIDYLNRLMVKSGLFDKVNIEYADINYASKFTKGPDGNYYGTVTFVQKFQGFIDGNLVYGDQTKRIMVIVLKHYEKEVNGQKTSGWDVYLDDIGIVETKKL